MSDLAGRVARRGRRALGYRGLEHRLVWLFGSPRTGSTWLLALLDSHRRVVAIDEPAIGAHLAPFTPDLFAAPAAAFPDGHSLLNTTRAEQPAYFFARDYADVWGPAVRKLMLARFGAHVERRVRRRAGDGRAGADAVPRREVVPLGAPYADRVQAAYEAHAPAAV